MFTWDYLTVLALVGLFCACLTRFAPKAWEYWAFTSTMVACVSLRTLFRIFVKSRWSGPVSVSHACLVFVCSLGFFVVACFSAAVVFLIGTVVVFLFLALIGAQDALSNSPGVWWAIWCTTLIVVGGTFLAGTWNEEELPTD